MLKDALNRIDGMHEYAVKLLMDIISKRGVNPDYGGEGEYDKAMYILEVVKSWGLGETKTIYVNDPRAKNGVRPNILVFIRGETSEKLWIVSHLDVVPPGDLNAWTITKPFEPKFIDGRVYGRGAEDNGQAIVSSLLAAKAVVDAGAKPRRTIVLAFVSDEEAGSRYGMEYIVSNYPELFSKNDVALVPDYGKSDGRFIEVAEKSILWLKIRFKGFQIHASTPHRGVNSHRIATEFLHLMNILIANRFGSENPLFDPPYTTCEPTMVRNTAESPNIIPGEHEVVVDCRILPEHPVDELLKSFKNIASTVKEMFLKEIEKNVYPDIEIETINKFNAPQPTLVDSPIVKTLIQALKELRGVEPVIGGIGGGTLAASFRKLGIPAVAWATLDNTAHMPNEYSKINNLIEDAKIIAYLMLKS
ncbi:MAG: M20 family metallo-hydrolase [Ignisphaera sp.]